MTNPDHEELVKLAEELREFTAFRYAGNCKCGKCQLLPRELIDRLYSALRRLASSDSGVKVRELEWGYNNVAASSLGKYMVDGWGNGEFSIARPGRYDDGTCYPSIDAARAAAQADYEARIKSALVEVPAVKGEPVRWEWCCFEDNEQRTGWQCERHGDQNGWEKLAESNPTKYRIVRRPLYTAPPADAGMREALERALTFYDNLDRPHSPGEAKLLDLMQAALARAALTAPGATTKSDGGWPLSRTAGGFPVAAAPSQAEETGVIQSTRQGAGVERGMDQCVTGGESAATNSGPSDPSSTRSEVTVPCGLDRPSASQCPNMKEVGGGMEGERYRCDVCGQGYYLDYEDMK